MTEIVRALVYSVAWADDVDYERAPKIQVEMKDFDLELFGRELQAILKREYFTIEKARKQVENYLRGWEIIIGITEHPDAVHFKYERAKVEEVGMNLESGHHVQQGKANIETSVNLSATPHVSRGNYPRPVDPFLVDSVVEVLYARYSRYAAGRELLTSMAYFCLTVIEASASGRKEAAEKYHIAKPVLDCLGRYCSEKGSKEEARKAPKTRKNLAFASLNLKERKWVLAAVKLLIRRAGEVAAGSDETLDKITLQDLPNLEELP